MNEDFANDHPEVVAALEKLSGKITGRTDANDELPSKCREKTTS